MAVEQDVKGGRAVFYLGNAGEVGAVHVDIGLPHCAIVHAEGASVPAIVIQSERADPKHYIGYRPETAICYRPVFTFRLSDAIHSRS